MAGWTVARKKNVESYIATVAPVLRLADWDIAVSWVPLTRKKGEDDNPAEISPYGQAKKAEIQFSDGFLLLSTERQRQVLVHELLHCHLFWLSEQAQAAFDLLDKRSGKLAASTHNLELERATDALADALAPLLPPFRLDASEPLTVVPPASASSRSTRPRGVPSRRTVVPLG